MKAVYLQKCNTWKTESLKNTSISYFNLPVFLISFFFFFFGIIKGKITLSVKRMLIYRITKSQTH